MNTQSISLGRCFSQGWEAFKQQAGIAIGSFLLYSVISGAASYTGIGAILAVFPLVGGLTVLYLGIMKNLYPEISTLFAGFSSVDNWARWLGVGWLLTLYQLLALLICAIPGGILAGIGALAIWQWNCTIFGIMLISLGIIVTLVAYIAVTIRWTFVFLAGAEGATAFNAIQISEQLTEGFRFEIFWILIALNLFNLAGMLLCGLGIIVTVPVTQLALSALYLDIKQMKAQQATFQS